MNGKKLSVLITEILAFLMGIISAYGGSCPAFNPENIDQDSPALYAVMSQFQWAFIILNILTYIAAIATLVMIYALIKRKKWFYKYALWTAILGCVSGLIPYLLVTLNGAGTPSHLRAIIYGIVIILLLIPGFKKDLKDNIQVVDEDSGSIATNVSAFLFFPGVLIYLQTLLTLPSHDFGGNVEMFTSIQIGIGLVLIALGVLVFSISMIKKHSK